MSQRKERFLTYFFLNNSRKKEKLATSSSHNESFPSNSSSDQNEQDTVEEQTKPEETIPNWTDESTLNVEKFERIDLKTYKCETGLVDKKFSIMLLVDSVLKYIRNPDNVLEYDDQVP